MSMNSLINRALEVETLVNENPSESLIQEAKRLYEDLNRAMARPNNLGWFNRLFMARDAAYRASQGFSAEQQAECRWEAMAMNEDSPWNPNYYEDY